MTHTTNKQIKAAYNNFLNSHMYNLRDLYNNYSVYKENAYNYCRELFNNNYGDIFKIIGGNSMTFSVGFTGMYPDPTTKELKKAFFYITKSYDRYIFLDEMEE